MATTTTSELTKKSATTTITETTRSEPDPIQIRIATHSDLAPLSQCLARAFYDEVLFGRLIHTNRAQHPNDMHRYWLRTFQRDYWDYAHVFLGAFDTTVTPHRCVGAAQWARSGSTALASGWGLRWFDPRNLLWCLGYVQSVVCKWLWPNRAADAVNEDVIERAYPFTEHVWKGPVRGEVWYLNFLGVDPGYQGRGVGRKLVEWGMERAEKERVACSVIAAHTKDPFYQSCGFDTMFGSASGGEGNPLAGVPGGNIWFRFFPEKRDGWDK